MKSNSQLQQDVIADHKWFHFVHAEHIGVEVREGVMSLDDNMTIAA